MSLSKFSGLVVLCAGLLGCAGQPEHVVPGASAADARKIAGNPTEERRLSDGTTAWYYVSGPCGSTTYRVHLDANDRVIDAGQVLTENNIRSNIVANKTTRAQVVDGLGQPAVVSQFPNIQEEVLTYRYRDNTQDMLADIHVDTANGLVKTYAIHPDPSVGCQ